MSQNEPSKTSPQETVPASTELASKVNEDIGGVQGEAPEADEEDAVPSASSVPPSEEVAPDAGEIEWAGQLVKKPPTPGG